MKPNIIAIPDIHGDFDAMNDSLSAAQKLLNTKSLSITNPSHLVFLGDLIDRGPDSLDVIEQVLKFKRSFKDRVNYICGNHEAMLFQFLFQMSRDSNFNLDPSITCNFIRNGGLSTLVSFMQLDECPLVTSLFPLVQRRINSDQSLEIFKNYHDDIYKIRHFLAQHPLIHEFFINIDPAVLIDSKLFVHGGFTPEFLLDNFRAHNWFEDMQLHFAQSIFSGFNGCMEGFDKFNKASSSRAGTGVAGPFWTDKKDISNLTEVQRLTLVDLFSVYNISQVVVGHSVVSKVQKHTVESQIGNVDIVFLDTGMSDFYAKPYDKQALVIIDGETSYLDSYSRWQNLS